MRVVDLIAKKRDGGTLSRDEIEVFVNGNTKPSLVVTPLVHSGGKMAGFWVGNGSDGSWRDLRVNGVTILK